MKAIAFKRNLVIALTTLLLGAFVVPSNGLADLNDGLVGYWSFDNQADPGHDDSENGNNGTVYGATWIPDGISGGALDFDGEDDYVSLDAHVANLGIDITDDYTIVAWIRTMLTADPGPIYNMEELGGASPGILVQMQSSGYLKACVQNGSYWVCSWSDDSHNDGEWHHVAEIYHGHPTTPTVELYIDGLFVDDSTGYIPSFSAPDFHRSKIARGAHAANLYFQGSIDEVRIYERALSEPEIRELYQNRGLVGYWSFDNEFDPGHDDSETGNDGTVNGATWIPDGISGGALIFDGSNDYLTCGNDGTLNMTTNDFTLSAWVKTNVAVQNNIIVCKYTSDTPPSGWELLTDFSHARVFLYRDASQTRNVQGGCASDNEWHHIAGVTDYDGCTRLYLDGVEIGIPDNTVYSTMTSTQPVRIAARGGGDAYFLGIIDEVRIYRRALSEVEIESLSFGRRLRGDANGDAVIDIGDVIYLINYLFTGTSAPDPLWVGDCNCDDVVDIGDVIYLINYLFTGTSPPGC